MAKRVLLTGAAGFIGSHTADALLTRGDHVIGLDALHDYYDPALKRRNLAEVRAAGHRGRFDFVEGDVRDRTRIRALVAQHQPQAIVHLAALAGVRASIGQADLYNEVNVRGTIHLLDAARDHGVECFVFASTSSVYGNTQTIPFVETDRCDRPLAPYPASKRSCELLGHSFHNLHGLNFSALRFFTVYGPRNRPDMMAGKLLTSIEQGTSVPYYGAQLERDWTYVADIADGIVRAVDRPLGFEILNLGRGQPVALAEFIDLFQKLSGGRASLDPAQMPAADVRRTFADISRARQLLGYEPQCSVAQGVEALWQWFQDRGPS